jgi:hypothetical protein
MLNCKHVLYKIHQSYYLCTVHNLKAELLQLSKLYFHFLFDCRSELIGRLIIISISVIKMEFMCAW